MSHSCSTWHQHSNIHGPSAPDTDADTSRRSRHQPTTNSVDWLHNKVMAQAACLWRLRSDHIAAATGVYKGGPARGSPGPADTGPLAGGTRKRLLGTCGINNAGHCHG
jgi:hypothetical protein